MGSELSNEQVL